MTEFILVPFENLDFVGFKCFDFVAFGISVVVGIEICFAWK
jgi:hypothetical protein